MAKSWTASSDLFARSYELGNIYMLCFGRTSILLTMDMILAKYVDDGEVSVDEFMRMMRTTT